MSDDIKRIDNRRPMTDERDRADAALAEVLVQPGLEA